MRRALAVIAMFLFHVGFARPVLRWGAGVNYRRRNLVPRGPCIVVSNHNSHLDAAVLMGLFPLARLPRVHPVAAADYFGQTWLLRTMAMLFMNAIAIDRRPRHGVDPLEPMAEAIGRGESLIFFPEGSRGEAGVMQPFRPGIGRLVQRMPGLLIVPVYLSGPERIWPRGQMVPVPLSIDGIVGRPRSYDPSLDAKEIAEQVQRDVLALAPPPPPEPRSSAPPVRVAVCAVDLQLRAEAFRALTATLGLHGGAVGVGEPALEAGADGVREVTGPIPRPRGRAWLGLLAWIFRTRDRYKGERFVRMVERAQVDEAVGERIGARWVVTQGNELVDLLAWAEADFYKGVFNEAGFNRLVEYLAGHKRIPYSKWWRFMRHAPEVWLINVFDLVRPPLPDVLVLLTSPAARTMQALRHAGRKLERNENEEFLELLQEAYRQAARALRKRGRVRVIEVEAAADGIEAAIAAVEREVAASAPV